MKKNICLSGLGLAAATMVYIVLVALLMNNANELFGKMTGILGIVAFLLLFTFSAAVVGGLVLGKPLMMYLGGIKKEAVLQLLATLGWLLAGLIIVFVVLLVV